MPMGSETYHHGNLREALIAAAIDKLDRQPEKRLSLRDMARDVGVSANAAYRHFSGLDAVLAAVATAGFQSLSESLRRARDQEHSDVQKLKALCNAYVQFARDRPAMYHLIFDAKHFGTDEDQALREASLESFDLLRQNAAPFEPARTKTHDRTLATTIWSALHGIVTLADAEMIDAGSAETATSRRTVVDATLDQLVSWVVGERTDGGD